MYSKVILIAVSSFVMFSCGLKVGEPAPKSEIVELKNTKCLNDAIASVKLFFDGEATDKEVDSSFKCFSQVLIAFKDNVNGADREFFSPEELAYFVENNFLKGEYSFRSEFLSEIMRLKFVLIGGSDKVFYKKDIEALAKTIDRIRPEIVKINPEMKIISDNWVYTIFNDTDKEAQFLSAKQKSAKFFEILSDEFSKTGNKYEAEHFLNFIKEIAIFAKAEKSLIEKIEQAKPFLINFKKNLVGQGTQIESGDWAKISKSLHEMLFQLLRVNYFLKPLAEDQHEQKWIVYQKISEDLFQLISTLLEAQKKPVLTNQQVFDLISGVLPIFSEQTIDEDLVESIAELKMALLGSQIASQDKWIPSDLNKIKAKLPVLFTEIRKIFSLFKEMNTLTLLWNKSYSDFNTTEINFNKSIQDLMSVFDGEYSLGSAHNFLRSLGRNKLLPGFELPANFEGLCRVSFSLKYMLVGGEGGTNLSNSQLKHVVSTAAAGYFHYLEYRTYIKPLTTTDAVYFSGIDNVLPKIKATAQKILNFKNSRIISSNEILSLYGNLLNEKIIESNVSLLTVSSVTQALWSNILIEPKNRLTGKVLPGFNYEALNVLFAELKMFVQSGKDISEIFKADKTLEQKVVLNRINQLQAVAAPIQDQSLTELYRVISGPLALTHDQKDFLRLFDASVFAPSDILKVQIARTMSRVLIRSYSNDILNTQKITGITLPEAQVFFNSMRPLLVDLDLIAATNTTFISSRFREANLFVGHANGDDQANFEELTDLIIHIFSGVQRANVLRDGAAKKCLPPLTGPILGTQAISEDCLLQHYYETTAGFESMPRFTQMKTVFSFEQNRNYYMSLLKAAGHIPNANHTVLFDDANLFPHVVQYVEVIFAKYDLNQDNILVKDEALRAYPVFRSTIREVLKTMQGGNSITEKQLPGVFIYLLKYGRPPSGLAEKLKFLSYISNEDKWVIESNRLDLGVIFNFIAESLAKP